MVFVLQCPRNTLTVVCSPQLEQEEAAACGGGVKMEEGPSFPSPGDPGKELLRHLLKDKMAPASGLLAARRHLSTDSARSDEADRPGSYGNVVSETQETCNL